MIHKLGFLEVTFQPKCLYRILKQVIISCVSLYLWVFYLVYEDVLLWTPTYGHAKAGRPARIYIQQLCEDTGCSPEDLPEAMNDREKWRERVRDIRASGMT